MDGNIIKISPNGGRGGGGSQEVIQAFIDVSYATNPPPINHVLIVISLKRNEYIIL